MNRTQCLACSRRRRVASAEGGRRRLERRFPSLPCCSTTCAGGRRRPWAPPRRRRTWTACPPARRRFSWTISGTRRRDISPRRCSRGARPGPESPLLMERTIADIYGRRNGDGPEQRRQRRSRRLGRPWTGIHCQTRREAPPGTPSVCRSSHSGKLWTTTGVAPEEGSRGSRRSRSLRGWSKRRRSRKMRCRPPNGAPLPWGCATGRWLPGWKPGRRVRSRRRRRTRCSALQWFSNLAPAQWIEQPFYFSFIFFMRDIIPEHLQSKDERKKERTNLLKECMMEVADDRTGFLALRIRSYWWDFELSAIDEQWQTRHWPWLISCSRARWGTPRFHILLSPPSGWNPSRSLQPPYLPLPLRWK